MKKITSVIAIVLLAALLLTGCDFIPLKQDFSQYGFTFTIAGEVTEKEGNKAKNATLYTKLGTLTFELEPSITIIVEISMEDYIAKQLPNKRTLENGARLYTSEAKDNGSGVLVIESYCYIDNGDETWQIKGVTPKDDFDEDALVKVFESVQFVEIAK